MKSVSVGILKYEDKVLACQRRSNASYPLKWEFPGGKIELGESPLQALARELREELDIEIRNAVEFFRQEWSYDEDFTGHGSYDVHYFLVDSFVGVLRNKTFEQIDWVTPEELLGFDILEGNRSAIKILITHDLAEKRI